MKAVKVVVACAAVALAGVTLAVALQRGVTNASGAPRKGTVSIPSATPFRSGSRAAQWARVDEAIQKGLPKTAIEELEPIIAAALRDKAYPEAIKAIAQKIALEGNIQGNKPEEKITAAAGRDRARPRPRWRP